MRSVAVGWGYGSDLQTWQADTVISHPLELVAHLR
jgi:phosphoglycolate phosphatase-like HAD superfamily hydrolase